MIGGKAKPSIAPERLFYLILINPPTTFTPFQNFASTHLAIESQSQPYQPFETVCILAPGLLGASVAMACKKNRIAKKLNVWSRRSSTRAKLAGMEWCDTVSSSPQEAAKEADLVVICTPVDFVVPLYNEIKSSLKRGTLATDVGSTKSLICRQVNSTSENDITFIGSHPMAGSEKTGMDHADEDLFVNRPCIITPLETSQEDAILRIIQFWKSLGAITCVRSPEQHDEIVAHISHLPHILASTLCHLIDQEPEDWRPLASTGLMDTTRIAAGDPAMWKAIIESNTEEIRRALSKYQDELYRIQSALTNGNMVEIVKVLENGKQFRNRLGDRT